MLNQIALTSRRGAYRLGIRSCPLPDDFLRTKRGPAGAAAVSYRRPQRPERLAAVRRRLPAPRPGSNFSPLPGCGAAVHGAPDRAPAHMQRIKVGQMTIRARSADRPRSLEGEAAERRPALGFVRSEGFAAPFSGSMALVEDGRLSTGRGEIRAACRAAPRPMRAKHAADHPGLMQVASWLLVQRSRGRAASHGGSLEGTNTASSAREVCTGRKPEAEELPPAQLVELLGTQHPALGDRIDRLDRTIYSPIPRAAPEPHNSRSFCQRLRRPVRQNRARRRHRPDGKGAARPSHSPRCRASLTSPGLRRRFGHGGRRGRRGRAAGSARRSTPSGSSDRFPASAAGLPRHRSNGSSGSCRRSARPDEVIVGVAFLLHRKRPLMSKAGSDGPAAQMSAGVYEDGPPASLPRCPETAGPGRVSC